MLLTPRIAKCQHYGVVPEGSYGWGDQVVPLRDAASDAEFIPPGWLIGGSYTARDSSTCFRVQGGWDHQEWEQRFSRYLYQYSGPSTSGYRAGTMERGIELLGVVPQVAFRSGPSSRLLLGVELGVVLSVRTKEEAANTITSGGSPSNPGGSSSNEADTTYYGSGDMNDFQLALRVGYERTLGRGFSLAGAFVLSWSTFAPAYDHRDRVVPGYLRLGVLKTIGRRLLKTPPDRG